MSRKLTRTLRDKKFQLPFFNSVAETGFHSFVNFMRVELIPNKSILNQSLMFHVAFEGASCVGSRQHTVFFHRAHQC